MQIASITIENFRSISRLEIAIDSMTSLVGGNNAGKSTILRAIELFFDPAPRISAQDHFMHDLSRKISISIEFCGLVPVEIEEFSHAVNENKLRVVREFGDGESGEYSVYAKVNPVFEKFRQEKNGTARRTIYAELRKSYDLPVASGEEMEGALKKWESENPGKLENRVVRGFFGAKNVALGKLAKKTSVRLVPAVKDTSDELSDAKRSPVIGLLSEIVKQTFENKKEFVEFIAESNQRLADITDPAQVPQLSGISEKLTSTLSRYYSDTGLVADLNKANDISISFPSPAINVLHRGLRVDVGQVGHGLQRAILFSVVQFLAEEQSSEASESKNEGGFTEPHSDIILLIEEPEIYQHPLKQTLFYEAFKEIVSGYSKSSGIRIQIIYATHSEKFVNIVDVDKLRLISKRTDENVTTICRSLTIGEFSRGMAAHIGPNCAPMAEETFKAGLHIFSREVSEAFFAEKAILVEGVSDREILRAVYSHRDINPSHAGIAIIQLDGKTKIDKPLFALRKLGIPVYPVFDNDSNKTGKERANAAKRNKLIQSIVGREGEEEFPSGCEPVFAAFEGNLEKYLQSEMGEAYGAIKSEICTHYNIGGGEACKSPAVVSGMLVRAKAAGYKFDLLEQIIDRVAAL